MTGVEVSALLDRIQALEQSVDDLMSGGVARIEEPELRVRISHAFTARDGWRCDSTTVEWTGRGTPNYGSIQAALESSYDIGAGAARERNAHEAAA